MANDFKPATDRSLADLNRANRDAWDSGEFKHGDAGRAISPAQRRQVAVAASKGADPVAETYGHAKANKLNRKDPGSAKAGYGRFGAEVLHSEGKDIRHPKGGGQQVVGEGGEVVVHAHDETASEMKARLEKKYGSEPKVKPGKPGKETLAKERGRVEAGLNASRGTGPGDRAVHLPRTAKRTWKNGVWS